jgi:8-amino-7-oxononanoate synthase
MSLSDRWSAVLDDLRGKGRSRSLRLPAGIDFTSNDYLGYGNGRLANTGREPTWLSHSGIASRLLRGHHPIWDEVESQLAAWHGADAALMMTSGYAANEGLLATVVEPGDWVAADEFCHASIIDGLRLARPRKFRFRHNDLTHLEEGLKAEAAKRTAGRELFVVTESLFSLDGDTAPLSEVVALAERYGAQVIVDEAHSTGCFGPRGSGCVDAAGLRGRVLATVHTGGKALGVHGAYVCGSRLLREFLVNRCRHLIFTTALPPVVGAWWRDRIPQVQEDDAGRRLLYRNAAVLREGLARHGIRPPGSHYVVPVIVGDDEPAIRAAERLQALGNDVRAIRPPSVPDGTCRLRVSVHADHEPAVLSQLAEHVARAFRT